MIGTNTQARYGAVAMALHWLIAAALVVNIAIGLYMSEILAGNDPGRLQLLQIHKPVGLTVLVLSLIRLAWRLFNPAPPLPPSMPPSIRRLTHVSHFLLYVLIIAIPLTGWALVSASRSGLPTNYFGLFHWPSLPILASLPRPVKLPLHHDFNLAHVVLAISAIVLILIHVAGAFYHRGCGDNVLARMVPWEKFSRAD